MTDPSDMIGRRSIEGAVARVAARLPDERRVKVAGARGPARAALVAQLARFLSRPLLVFAANVGEAELLAQDLRFFLGEANDADLLRKRVHVFPAWDTAAFAPMSPSPETIAQRIEGLYHLRRSRNPVIVTTPEAVLQRVMPPAALDRAVTYLVEGEEVDLADLAGRLADWGYRRRPLVEDRGEFAVRGGLVDVFVTGQPDPHRLELIGDTLDSIRTFDARSQRRVEACEDALILPAAEVPLAARQDPARLRIIEERARELEMPRRERLALLDALAEGTAFPGYEALAPYLAPLVPMFEYLPADTVLVRDEELALVHARDEAWESVLEHARLADEERRLYPPPEALFLPGDELAELVAAWPCVELDSLGVPDGTDGTEGVAVRLPFEVRDTRLLREKSQFAAVADKIRGWVDAGDRVALVVGSASQAERLRNVLESQELMVPVVGDDLPTAVLEQDEPAAFIVEGELSGSVWLPEDRLVCVAELNLFGEHRRSRRRKAVALTLDEVMRSLEQLKPEDCVVHLDHGIGRYHGLTHLTVAGEEGDFLLLEYHGGDRLYLPVDRVNLVQKYVGGDGKDPDLDKLGGNTWEKVKQKTKESILAMAHELLNLYAVRQRNESHAFSSDDPYYQEFEARFPFDETPDQGRAIREVLADLGKGRPMDRLVCGDVGYGKTEVAMRAAFVVAMEGKQVAILVPTTVLAQQHTESIRKRFAGYPVNIEMVSSFRTRKENLGVLAGLKAGSVDIVVGTHRLLQADVEFARLGLLVVDEEHRFGVRDKERVKQIRKLVDVLTLSATPIPRTLELSLTGIRDLSVIETPPLDRQAIRTYVTRSEDAVIREALLRELRRGGQAFFVHNRVQSIERTAEKLRALVPEAKIVVGHGQMREHQLEKVMMGFLEHEFDVLCCTAIVESGLDIPNANTILINRADMFGLAQLYQLRGRVGRSPARAYAYLLIPGEQILSKDARLRLQVLQELDDLGGGFKIAAHDLEIRGAGNLLGKKQSGHVTAVGFELYTRMMEEAVHELRGEPIETDIEPEVHLGIPVYIPDSYVNDVNQRLVWYKRLAALRRAEDRVLLAEELRDRYGPIPSIVDTLLDVMELRRRMKMLGILEARVRGARIGVRFHESSQIPAESLVDFVTLGGSGRTLQADGTLTVSVTQGDELLGEVSELLSTLEGLGRIEPAAGPLGETAP
ncbi:MAG: transcription-repair coupling factor [Candidatus Binatia bacterium]|nr:transcription-repair coupling factor [Candidatus Binatia bacterium]